MHQGLLQYSLQNLYWNNDVSLTTSLKNQLLIAMPSLNDSFFKKSVTYICEHNENGAIGIIINQPLTQTLSFVFEQMDIASDNEQMANSPLLFGGPVQQERGFVLHAPSGHWRSSMPLKDDLSITTSKDILEALAQGEGPKDAIVALGYAGWEANQLESELAENSWLTSQASHELLFDVPFHNRWEAAANQLGIDIKQLSQDVGHA